MREVNMKKHKTKKQNKTKDINHIKKHTTKIIATLIKIKGRYL